MCLLFVVPTVAPPGAERKKELVHAEAARAAQHPPPKKLLNAQGYTRTTGDHEPNQHFMPPPNNHLPERMSYAEFTRRFVEHNISIHDPSSEDYKPFALPPPAVKPGVDPWSVFDRLDTDSSGDLTIPELKQMRSMAGDVQMPQASMAGIRQQYFEAEFAERMPPEQDLDDVFKQLDEDSNGVLTRMETKVAAKFFKGDL